MIRVGIYGGAGYTAGELIRLLVNHPACRIEWVASQSQSGRHLTEVHEGLVGDTDLVFSADAGDLTAIDLLFLCQGHGQSAEFWERHPLPDTLRVIDLAQDFRDESRGYVYGLPEWQAPRIREARLVANPGCFATAIQLALLPAARMGLLRGDVTVNALTGSTGAGQRPTATTHFSWRTGNLSIYKPFTHQHLLEIRRTLSSVQPDLGEIDFIPYRGDFARGIFCTALVRTELAEASEVIEAYKRYYQEAPFTHYADQPIDLKQVVNTNKCLLHIDFHHGRLLITSCIDNLLKGAVGQAVENMNLMFGLDERAGLHLKASAF
ncbi:MAG: N-acetyl-gamma-glutamyl-phosphate reductase [Bacteroidaceae bacterium]|nr:N-acetyl-gamma-glutamyl-phosphate reductase [Bacteroidaceae bacterium]